jgi:hypothetical protein
MPPKTTGTATRAADELPPELQTARGRRERLRAAKQALDAEREATPSRSRVTAAGGCASAGAGSSKTMRWSIA